MLWLCALALLCALQDTLGSNAGLKVRLTQKGIDHVLHIAMDELRDILKTITIPDKTGQFPIPFGKVDYAVSGIRIHKFQFSESAGGFTPRSGVQLSIRNANIQLNGNWRAFHWLLGGRGSIEVVASGISSSVLIGVHRADTGRLSVSMVNCIFSIGPVRANFRGGKSWLYNWFKGRVEQPIRDVLSSQLCSELDKAIAKLNDVLKTMEVSAQIDRRAAIDYSLVESPLFTDKYMELDLKGECYSKGSRSEPPFSPAPFSIPDENSQMLYIGISEFVANSAGFVYFTSGSLQINLTDNMVPSDSGIRLKTESFEGLIPEVPKRYPNRMLMLHVSARKQPVLTCLPGSLDLAVYGSILASVILPDSTLAPLFHLDMAASWNAKVSISGSRMSMSLELSRLTFSLVNSTVGSFEADALQTLLTRLLKMEVQPKLNEKLMEGIPLPDIKRLTPVNPRITFNQGYILISTDMQYSL